MKKQLLAIAAMLCGIVASATGFSVNNKTALHPELMPNLHAVQAPAIVSMPMETAMAPAADGSAEIYYTLAGTPSNALSLNSQSPGMQIAMAFQFDPTFIANLTDGEITGISYYTGCESNNKSVNKITKAYVFITDDLTASEFLYTQEVTAPTTSFTKVDAILDTPFAIPADKKIYCGVYFNVNSTNNASIVVDYTGHANDLGGWVAYRTSSKNSWYWQNIASGYGFMTLGATVRGKGMPENCVSLVAVDGMPVAYEDTPFGFDFLLQNDGVNAVNNITVEYGIDNEPSTTSQFNISTPMEFNQMLIGSVSDFIASEPAKSSNITITITAVNGNPNTSEQKTGSYPIVIVPEGKGLDRNVVIEEFTSTSCVYCPVGYTAMEQIHEECTDGTIIPVCIHVNYPGRDVMTATSFNNVYYNYCTEGVPSAILNRTYDQYPYYEDLIELADQIKAMPGIAAVTGEATIDEANRTVTIDTKTKFSFDYEDGEQNFILAYAITEDEVGPYTQQNGYAGASYTVPGDWQTKNAEVDLVYNDVARQLDRYSGIVGSIPSAITSGEEYAYTHNLSLLRAVSDLSKIHIVVYLLNRKTGAIENACTIKSPLAAGISDVITDADNNAPVEYYNLQGVRVANPENGIFIRRQGAKVSKVALN